MTASPAPRRLEMTLRLAPSVVPPDSLARLVRSDDQPQLAALLLDAYRGSMDDSGETYDDAVAEVRRTLSGEYGLFDDGASSVTVVGSQFASATLVTRWCDRPFLAFSITHPDHRRRGYARLGIHRAAALLAERGETELRLVVTRGNSPAESLYRSLGFTPVE